ncbi:hypothetical protein EXE58_10340 [Nocardioides seonyuensis]|uniref:FlgD/Vpr Ig-like domain-containing protein n=1 Tax=Nocardioides seonyuensis TaxID=2518371 RepID=A0A4P7IF10_9ACTN|nr:FlgD immunoglobulin-like domain containing protein [Nocardioides seonyuensis]QBX55816.1 hypothetical protein EXE58_10340 [Nocardioides seonyuensis]
MTQPMASRRACLAALAVVVAAPLAAALPAAASAPPEFWASVEGRTSFSPNGDGVAERVRFGYELRQRGSVTVRIRRKGQPRVLLTRELPRRSTGEHGWTWGGRLDNGRRARHGDYTATFRASTGSDTTSFRVDRRFETRLLPQFPGERATTAAVYPRSVVVRDALPLEFDDLEPSGYRRAFVRITDPAGEVVYRRRITRRDRSHGMAWDARDRSGQPLAPGRYRAEVVGADRLGNEGVGPRLRIWVSADQLAWTEETRILRPRDTRKIWPISKYQKDDYFTRLCGTVEPIEDRPGALRHRAGVCDVPWGLNPWAESHHYLPVQEAVRGIEAFRVAFTGAPATAGGDDLGHLVANANGLYVAWGQVTTDVESTSGAQTPWGEASLLGRGGAYWAFWTEDDDAFDVLSFTVDLRYLAPPS